MSSFFHRQFFRVHRQILFFIDKYIFLHRQLLFFIDKLKVIQNIPHLVCRGVEPGCPRQWVTENRLKNPKDRKFLFKTYMAIKHVWGYKWIVLVGLQYNQRKVQCTESQSSIKVWISALRVGVHMGLRCNQEQGQ